MSIEEIKINNELIAEFMGYIYKYKALEDYSECGGLTTNGFYYSKVPLEFKHIENDVHYFLKTDDASIYGYFFVYESGYFTEWMYNSTIEYNKSWDKLMQVRESIQDRMEGYEFSIGRYEVNIKSVIYDFNKVSIKVVDSYMETVWLAAVEFIKKLKIK